MKNNVDIIDLEFAEFLNNLHDKDTVEIYTDGSCIGNPGPGGWGAVFIMREKRSSISGFEKNTTNNRMELMAAIKAINAIPKETDMIIYTDSAYVKNGITTWIKNWQVNNWKSAAGKPIKNQDLWELLLSAIEDRSVEWVWVKGHAECTNNNNADFIARSAIVESYMQENEPAS